MPVNKSRPRYVHGSSNEVWDFPGRGFVRRGEFGTCERRMPCLSATGGNNMVEASVAQTQGQIMRHDAK